MALKLRPLADRVIVEPQEREETFAGGQLVLPETAKEKPQQGTVLAVGPGRRDDAGKHIAMDVKKRHSATFFDPDFIFFRHSQIDSPLECRTIFAI